MGTRGGSHSYQTCRVGQEHLGHMQIENIYFEHKSSFNCRCSLGTRLVQENKTKKETRLENTERWRAEPCPPNVYKYLER